jgi:hypothetical protein
VKTYINIKVRYISQQHKLDNKLLETKTFKDAMHVIGAKCNYMEI